MEAMTVSTPSAPDTDQETDVEKLTATDIPWVVIVWNDPVNLMSYVSYVFQSYFGYTETKAHKLMLEVHEQGKSVVATGAKENMEQHTTALHSYGLWATFQKADQA